MMLGNRIAEKNTGGNVRLYSNFPFPWRKGGGANDDFEREAIRQLKMNPEQPFYRFETVDDRPVLRYATADLMRTSCVNKKKMTT